MNEQGRGKTASAAEAEVAEMAVAEASAVVAVAEVEVVAAAAEASAAAVAVAAAVGAAEAEVEAVAAEAVVEAAEVGSSPDFFSPGFLRQIVGSAPPEQCALVVSGSPEGVVPGLVARLAPYAGLIVAVDSGADVARAAGLTPALLLGDFDSIDPQTLASLGSQGVETVTHEVHKDATDLELALDALWQRGFRTIVATNILGGRVDHELAALGNLAAMAERGATVLAVAEGGSLVFLSACDGRVGEGASAGVCDQQVACAGQAEEDARGGQGGAGVSTGTHGRQNTRAGLNLDFSATPAPSFVSLIPWGGEATVSISGVEWELDHAILTPSHSRGVSNVVVASQLGLAVHEGVVIATLVA
jgi:thiamine pyrophosphokinase